MKYTKIPALLVVPFFICHTAISMEQPNVQQIREQQHARNEKKSQSEQIAQEKMRNDIGSDGFNAWVAKFEQVNNVSFEPTKDNNTKLEQ